MIKENNVKLQMHHVKGVHSGTRCTMWCESTCTRFTLVLVGPCGESLFWYSYTMWSESILVLIAPYGESILVLIAPCRASPFWYSLHHVEWVHSGTRILA